MRQLGAKIAKMYGRYGFLDFFDSAGSRLVKKFKALRMTEDDIKNAIYGSIRELTKSRKYYYDGYRPHWTEEGLKVIGEVINLYGEKIIEAVRHDDEARSKQILLKGLKGEMDSK